MAGDAVAKITVGPLGYLKKRPTPDPPTHTDSVSLGMQPAMAETIHYLPLESLSLSNFLSFSFNLSVCPSVCIPPLTPIFVCGINLTTKITIIYSLQLQITSTGFGYMNPKI